MTPGVISFSCSSCGVRLTVPESMAGISGPCPSCSATIQAPAATVEPAPAAAEKPAAPVSSPAPVETPAAPVQPPAPQAPPEPAKTSIPSPRPGDTPPSSIRPEPRAKPERETAKGIEPRHSTDDATMKRRQTVSSGRRSSESKGPGIGRVALPIFFIIAGATIVYVLCYFFLPGGPGESFRRNTDPPPSPPPVSDPVYPDTAATTPKANPPASVATTNDQVVSDAPPIIVDGADAIRAEAVLKNFLNARSLEERVALIDPPMTAEELEDTIVAEILPEVISISPDTPTFDPIERLTNFPFRVSFQGGEGSVVEYTIVVRKRADLEPQVVINPFLDLVGGRLAEFAAAPTEGVHTFYAIIEAMPRCFEENIPNPEKKFTYKLSTSDVGRATARTYASLNSSLAEQLWTPDSRIRWGKRIRATIALEWNTTEDPSQPYIELLEIRGLDWNS